MRAFPQVELTNLEFFRSASGDTAKATFTIFVDARERFKAPLWFDCDANHKGDAVKQAWAMFGKLTHQLALLTEQAAAAA